MHEAVEIHAYLPQRLHGEDILVGPEDVGGFVQVALQPDGQIVERRIGIGIPTVGGFSRLEDTSHIIGLCNQLPQRPAVQVAVRSRPDAGGLQLAALHQRGPSNGSLPQHEQDFHRPEYSYRQHKPTTDLITTFYAQFPRPIITNNGSYYRYVSDYQIADTLFGHFGNDKTEPVRTISISPEQIE